MRVLFVLSGDPPDLDLLLTEIQAADLTVAVDGGVDIFRNQNHTPDITIGDFDSKKTDVDSDSKCIYLPDQNQSDLQKAFNYIEQNYSVSTVVLLGANGGRTDHLINNLQICASSDSHIKIIIKQIIAVDERPTLETILRITPDIKVDLRVMKGTTLSVFAISHFRGLCSKGLKWELSQINSASGVFSQSNLANVDDPQFTLLEGVAYISIYQ